MFNITRRPDILAGIQAAGAAACLGLGLAGHNDPPETPLRSASTTLLATGVGLGFGSLACGYLARAVAADRRIADGSPDPHGHLGESAKGQPGPHYPDWKLRIRTLVELGLPIASFKDVGPRGVLIFAEEHSAEARAAINSLIEKLSALMPISVIGREGMPEDADVEIELQLTAELGVPVAKMRRQSAVVPEGAKLVGLEGDVELFKVGICVTAIQNILGSLQTALPRQRVTVEDGSGKTPEWRSVLENAMNRLREKDPDFPRIDLVALAQREGKRSCFLSQEHLSALDKYFDRVGNWLIRHVGPQRNLPAAEIMQRHLPIDGFGIVVIGAGHTRVVSQTPDLLPIQTELSNLGISYAILNVGPSPRT